MNKMNLLLIVPTLYSGGQERVAVNTAAILSESYNIKMVVFTMDQAVYKPACEVIDLNIPAADGYGYKALNVVRRARALKKLKRELNIDVSISFGDTANLANVLSRAADKIILSIHGYGTLVGSSISKIINKVIYRLGDRTICVSGKIATDLVGLSGVSKNKVVRLYNPYDFASIAEQSKAIIPFAIRHPAIVTMGRLEEVKGYRHLLRAFALVQHELPGATLIFLGEGSKLDELEKLVVELGMDGQVVFTGFQFNPYCYLAKCDLLALSSIHEGFPNAIVEAMACGLPVVAADCKSGPREILTEVYSENEATDIEYTDYGVLIPPFAADDGNEPEKDKLLADAIIQLLTDKKIYCHYKQKGQERAKAFSFEVYKDAIINIIEG